MITVVKETGDVLFFNENEHVSFAFSKDEKKFWAYPTQPTAHIGLPRQTIEVVDVAEVIYTNEAHPTCLSFKTDKTPATPSEYDNESLTALHSEIDKLDELEKEEKKKKYPNWGVYQKNGYARRFMNVCRYYNIETIGQLLKTGRSDFERLRNMGRECADRVSMALKNLYGIEKW